MIIKINENYFAMSAYVCNSIVFFLYFAILQSFLTAMQTPISPQTPARHCIVRAYTVKP